MGSNNASYSAKPSHKTRWIIIALIIILVLAINATWGWLYSNKRADFHNQLNNAQQTAKNQKSKNEQLTNELADSKQRLAEKDKQKPESEQTDSEYREIPELGVKYKLTDETKDLTYSYNGNNRIGFSTTQLVNFGQQDYPNQEACLPSNAPSGSITMYEPGSTVKTPKDIGSTGGTPVEQVEGAKKVGNNYFVFGTPQAVCTKNHTDAEKLALQVAKEAFNSLTPIGDSVAADQ